MCTFHTEPAWMQAARKAPLRSTYESRQPVGKRKGQHSEEVPAVRLPPRTDRVEAINLH